MSNEEAKKILMSDADFSGSGEKAKKTADALCVAISALELVGKTEQLERERDAAIADLKGIVADGEIDIDPCYYCKYVEEDGQCFHECNPFTGKWGWEWRGANDE